MVIIQKLQKEKKYTFTGYMEGEKYGIDIDKAHERAKALIPEEFFWSCIDELGPFGSDEGDTALAEFRRWRKENPATPTLECLIWTITGVGEMEFSEYNRQLVDREKILSQLQDKDFDDQQYIYTLDISVISTGFGQLVDEGSIDPVNKEIIQIAIDRQIIWTELLPDWAHGKEYIGNLMVLNRALKEA
ncbi:MAG TPA: hypothetical protein VNS58_24525 [Puia sp.]|nr:hypothetical protein [Puia sp.]